MVSPVSLVSSTPEAFAASGVSTMCRSGSSSRTPSRLKNFRSMSLTVIRIGGLLGGVANAPSSGAMTTAATIAGRPRNVCSRAARVGRRRFDPGSTVASSSSSAVPGTRRPRTSSITAHR